MGRRRGRNGMQQEQMIQTFHHIFLICLVLAGFSGSMTIIFFRKFQIREYLSLRMGRKAKKEMERIGKIHKKQAKEVYEGKNPDLSEEHNVTEKLKERKKCCGNLSNSSGAERSDDFIVKKNVMMIHTDEVIGRNGGKY